MKSIFPQARKQSWLDTKETFPNQVDCLFENGIMAYKAPVRDAFLNLVWAEVLNAEIINKVDKFFNYSPHCYCLDEQNAKLMKAAKKLFLFPAFQCRQYVKDLKDLMPDISVNNNINIKLVESDDEINIWCQTFCAGYEAYTPEYIKTYVTPFMKTSNIVLILGSKETKPVSTGMLEINGEIAGISGIATIPHHRFKGFARRTCNALENYAKKKNCRFVALNSTPNANKMYEKLGFKPYLEEKLFLPSKYVDTI